jgi:hypothetical protein
MRKYRVTVDRREGGKTVESNISKEVECYIGALFSYNKDNPIMVNGNIQICGEFGEGEIYNYAHLCADILANLTKGRKHEQLIWSRFFQIMDDKLEEHLEKQNKEKEADLRDSMRKMDIPDEEIDKVLDMINKVAHEGAEMLQASRRKEKTGDDGS